MSHRDKLVRTVRLTISFETDQIDAGNVVLQEEYIRLASQAKKELTEAGFKPFGDAIMYRTPPDFITDKETIALEMTGSKDV